jgi:hypothetical protein
VAAGFLFIWKKPVGVVNFWVKICSGKNLTKNLSIMVSGRLFLDLLLSLKTTGEAGWFPLKTMSLSG